MDRESLINVSVAVASTMALLCAFFSYITYKIEAEAELCMQRYDAPLLSFYDSGFDCFIPILELAIDVGHVFALVGGPLLLALVTMLWVEWLRRTSTRPEKRIKPRDCAKPRQIDMATQALFFFWTLTGALGFALGIGFACSVIGLWSATPGEAFSAAFFYGFHLYPAGLLAFGIVQTAAWLWRTAAMPRWPS